MPQRTEEFINGGLRIIQDDRFFKLGTDSLLLSGFPSIKKGLRVCDLGCGCGSLCALLAARHAGISVTGVEIQPEAADVAREMVSLNGLGDRVNIINGDINHIGALLPAGSFDLVVCNPPYRAPGSGARARREAAETARGEGACGLDGICAVAAYLLRFGGKICLSHRPDRLGDVVCALRGNGLEPKRLHLYGACGADVPSIMLAEGKKGAGAGVIIKNFTLE